MLGKRNGKVRALPATRRILRPPVKARRRERGRARGTGVAYSSSRPAAVPGLRARLSRPRVRNVSAGSGKACGGTGLRLRARRLREPLPERPGPGAAVCEGTAGAQPRSGPQPGLERRSFPKPRLWEREMCGELGRRNAAEEVELNSYRKERGVFSQ